MIMCIYIYIYIGVCTCICTYVCCIYNYKYIYIHTLYIICILTDELGPRSSLCHYIPSIILYVIHIYIYIYHNHTACIFVFSICVYHTCYLAAGEALSHRWIKARRLDREQPMGYHGDTLAGHFLQIAIEHGPF